MQFYQSKLLKNHTNLIAAFTTKSSGNLAFHVDDNKPTVLNNHKNVAQALHYNQKTVVHMQQIHSNIVKKVTDKDDFNHPPQCDALITDKKDIALMVMVADCVPLLFFDPVKEVIAVAHAGRAGVFSNIVHNVIAAFSKEYGSCAAHIEVVIGPSIGRCCYEVGYEIYLEAQALQLDFAIEKRENKYFLDIQKALHFQLLQEEVLETNIENKHICNACNTQDFYSYRVEKKTGRFAGVLMLTNEPC